MLSYPDDIDPTLTLLMELLYTGAGQEKPAWYVPDPDEWRASLDREVQQLEYLWRRFAFATIDPHQRNRYIRRQQRVVLHCLRWLEATAEEKVTTGYAKMALHRLLDFLLLHFEAELSKDLLTPRSQQVKIVSQLKTDLPALQKKLDQATVGSRMKQLIVELFISFIESSLNTGYFYGQVLMMQALMQSLLQLELSAAAIVQQLCYLNCNSVAVYQFLKRYFDKAPLTLLEKAHRYERISKYVKRLPVKKESFLAPERMRLTLQISDYFADLARDAKRQLKISPNDAANGAAYQHRLALRLTIEQLGLYIRLFKEVQILQPVPTAQIIRFCIRYLRTVGKAAGEEISYEYLKSTIARQPIEVFAVVEKQLDQMTLLLRKWRIEGRKTKS